MGSHESSVSWRHEANQIRRQHATGLEGMLQYNRTRVGGMNLDSDSHKMPSPSLAGLGADLQGCREADGRNKAIQEYKHLQHDILVLHALAGPARIPVCPSVRSPSSGLSSPSSRCQCQGTAAPECINLAFCSLA